MVVRVVHLVTSNAFAGIERHVVNLIREQRAAGIAAELACPPDATRLRAEALAAGAVVVSADGRAWTAWLARTLLVDPPDVLHVHDGRGSIGGALLSLTGRLTVVRTQHFVRTAAMARSGLRRRVSAGIHRLIRARTSGYIAVSQSVLEAGRRRDELGSAQVAVIAPAVVLPDADRVQRARTVRAGIAFPTLAFAGRLEGERQLDVLLAAVPAVRTVLPRFRLVIAGDGTDGARLQNVATRLGVTDAVVWEGWLEDAYVMFEKAHAYVNTWPDEAFGMAACEAMGLELPVIACNAGAGPELVEDGRTGILVAPGDPDALAVAIVALLSDLPGAASKGRAARGSVLDRFGGGACAAAHAPFYARCLEASAPS